jgi:hypothetical protein
MGIYDAPKTLTARPRCMSPLTQGCGLSEYFLVGSRARRSREKSQGDPKDVTAPRDQAYPLPRSWAPSRHLHPEFNDPACGLFVLTVCPVPAAKPRR